MDAAKFRADTERGKKALEDAIGCALEAYQASAWTVESNNMWVLEALGGGFKASTRGCPKRSERKWDRCP